MLPIPLPLTAFVRAYQTKGYNETSSNENDNDSREETMKMNENQPLDLSAEAEENDACNADKKLDVDKNETQSDLKIPTFTKSTKTRLHEGVHRNNSDENSRPLRKRKIIATSEELNSQ